MTKTKSLLSILSFLILLLASCGKEECSSETNFSVDEAQLAIDIAEIDTYLAQNNILAEKHPSGLRYVIKREGNGSNPSLCDNIYATYEGSYINSGEVFTSEANPTFLSMSNLIPGWQIGIPLIKDGSETGRISLYIPSELAYGSSGNGGIPPNSNLKFEIVLFNVQ